MSPSPSPSDGINLRLAEPFYKVALLARVSAQVEHLIRLFLRPEEKFVVEEVGCRGPRALVVVVP
jgi:hypothetical protein